VKPNVLARTISAIAMVAVVASLAPAVPAQEGPAAPYRDGDGSITALNILPPGQGKYMNGPDLAQSQGGGPQYGHNDDQIDMYDAMVQAAPGATEAGLTDLFKDASFGVKPDDIEREYSPRTGVTILRDEGFGVPHVYGTTRADTMFGVGYVSAEDRFFMMDVLRHLGRGRLSELLGASPSNLAQDRGQRAVADYTEDEFQSMLDRADDFGELGALAKQDIIDFTAGVNAWLDDAIASGDLPGEYPALQLVPEDWIPRDSVAVASVIGASLGVGGGQEVQNARFLTDLVAEDYSEAEAKAIYDDLRFRDDPEAPAKTHDVAFPWPGSDADPFTTASVVIPDDPQEVLDSALLTAAPTHIDGPFGRIPFRFPEGASNALLVGPELSKSGRPIAVFGPQTGYWSPEILMEIDMHGPGLHARGAAFPGVSLYVLLGRGADYGWSATSAGADQVDVFAVEICDDGATLDDPDLDVELDDNHYVNDSDDCVAMIDSGLTYFAKPSAGGLPDPEDDPTVLVEIPTWRVDLDHTGAAAPVADATSDTPGLPSQGIVLGRGLVEGVPHAFVRVRASYGGEVDSAITYVEMMDPDRIHGAADFQEAFGKFNFTFNWFFVGEEEIAWQLGGDHPLRAAGTSSDFPIRNAPDNRWTGVLGRAANPNAINPPEGYIVSWNNKQAPGFEAADNEWSYGPVHRSQPLEDRIVGASADDGKVSLVELVNAMGDAATVDLRGDKVLPWILEVVGGGDTPVQQKALDLLAAWNGSGAHRRDKNLDGSYEHARAVAIMDALWEPLLEAIFKDDLGAVAFDHLPEGHDNRPGPTGSAYLNGWYGHVQKSLRQSLGEAIGLPYGTSYCGVLADCRTAVLGAIDAAIVAVGGDPDTADADEDGDRIRFTSLGVQGQRSMQWQNRPTFQQVLEFGTTPVDGGGGGSGVPGVPGVPGAPAAPVLCPGLEDVAGPHAVGTGGDDVLELPDTGGVACGLGGNDTLIGGLGNDVLLGGPGNDTLKGRKGKDRLKGGPGKDRLAGGPGKDRLHGGKGRDVCNGGGAKDRFRGCERRRR